MARPDFRGTAARRLSEERELSSTIISLLSPEGQTKATSSRLVPVDRIEANPDQPRQTWDEAAMDDLAASIREHGVLQPVLVRPREGGRYQLVAGERRWRAAKRAGLQTVPAMIEEIDDDTALEIAIIENLQREDLSPLDEALMFERMTADHGYSVRKLAQKLGKDKGYIENRLRLADAPPEVQQLVSLRKDTLSHAYELLKVEDPRKRRRLAEQVARGELSLVKLRDRVEGRRSTRAKPAAATVASDDTTPVDEATAAWTGVRPAKRLTDDTLVDAKGHFAEALEELVQVLDDPKALGEIGGVDRANLAKYLTIVKLRLENAIAVVRAGEPKS
ncbi:MAG TPA: ParB/RepB/Spo0J family partition protein [Candidatus Sulfotelmatobacter sp.]|nr:ParB/RepB/Spo0J family partition protein [Candidatus Sulfotelmatobacter sp.]